ncbi:TraB/GumN family protein [Methylobrevis albus]|uniref:TraB/GumN family protein n=1 Tax=Methylobrevis albus TaxID=2793297 RepID=A0A931MY47_9HYPH|nr:TraB/GumN family protein [Methylobrevis albus]MBH0236709.1 TraB/GumN family protein [Methylobrevis albus]
MALAASAFAALAAPAAAEPALWKVESEHARVYLFGTMHALPPEADWRSPAIDAAFAESESIIFEIDIGRDSGVTAMAFHGTSPDLPLSRRLNPDDLRRVQKAAADWGVDFTTLEPLRPWLAAFTLYNAAFAKAGFDAGRGVEIQLLREAAQSFMPRSGLETAKDQFGIFGNLDAETELGLLMGTLEQIGDTEAVLGRMLDQWLAGDVAGIEQTVVNELKDESEEAYEVLLPRRNRVWIDRLVRILEGEEDEVVFVAVGAAHLVGPDSVQAMLGAAGYATERVNAPAAAAPDPSAGP